MRPNRYYPATTKRGQPPAKALLALGYGSFLILATLGRLVADEPASPAGAPDAGSLPTTPAAPADSPVADNSQPPDQSQAPANPQDQGPNTPLLPQQGGNPNSPYSSSSTNPQSPQITAPSLYLTGANNLSQVTTNAALSQAFSQQGAAGFTSEEGASYTYPPIERIRLGPIDLKAALTMNVVSDDNLRAGGQTQGKESDTTFGVTPAILLVYGEHEGQRGYASLIYAPTILRYYHHSALDTDNQNVALNLQYPFQRLTLDLTQTYTQATGVNIDSNTRTTQTASLTTVGGSYDIDDKLTLSSHLQEVITSYSGGGEEGDQVSSINNSLRYSLSDKITFGPSFNAGLDKPQNETNQTYEQGLLGMTYLPTEKINLFAQGGAEFRQYDGGGDKTNPIFSAGVGYTPFDSTTLSLNASQTVHSSAAGINQAGINQTGVSQTVVSTGVGVSATQRILQRFYLNFSFNYNHNETQNGTGGATTTATGSQDTLTYQPSIRFAPTAWTSVALYYLYLANESNTPGAAFHDNQVGISVSAQF